MKPKKTLYYHDALRDDFARRPLEAKPLPEGYRYIRRGLPWRAASFFVYRVLAVPVGFLASRLIYGVRVHGRQALRSVRGGAFLYINHTQSFHDAYMPLLLATPRRNYTLVSSAAVSRPVLRTLVPMLGGMPLPGSLTGMRGLIAAMEARVAAGACVTIYPEAHIWPYHTGIRPFPDTSFGYPVRMGAPVFAVVTTYRERRVFKNARPLIDVTVGGPYLPDASLPEKRARAALRAQVYGFMCETAGRPGNAAYYEYIEAAE